MMTGDWTIIHKRFKAPMGKWRGYTSDAGYFPCVSFQEDKAVRFKTKERAMLYMDNLAVKYPNEWQYWKISKFDKITNKEFNIRLRR